jgi:hypothetical protein
MIVSEQKKRDNIAEYIIYMYQIEDVIRAYQFNQELIIDNFVRPQLPDESFINDYRRWYDDLIHKMKSQRIEKLGHLFEINEVMIELSYLHSTLLNLIKDSKYITLFEAAIGNIEEFKEKSNLKDKNHIEIAFHALYMKLLLKLQKKEISPESEIAFDTMRILLAYLSKSFHKMKNGDLDFVNN